jgi:hypothetical protein
MIADAIAATTDIAGAVLAAPVPAHPVVRVGLIGIAALLFLCCLCAAHAPRRDRGGFR